MTQPPPLERRTPRPDGENPYSVGDLRPEGEKVWQGVYTTNAKSAASLALMSEVLQAVRIRIAETDDPAGAIIAMSDMVTRGLAHLAQQAEQTAATPPAAGAAHTIAAGAPRSPRRRPGAALGALGARDKAQQDLTAADGALSATSTMPINRPYSPSHAQEPAPAQGSHAAVEEQEMPASLGAAPDRVPFSELSFDWPPKPAPGEEAGVVPNVAIPLAPSPLVSPRTRLQPVFLNPGKRDGDATAELPVTKNSGSGVDETQLIQFGVSDVVPDASAPLFKDPAVPILDGRPAPLDFRIIPRR